MSNGQPQRLRRDVDSLRAIKGKIEMLHVVPTTDAGKQALNGLLTEIETVIRSLDDLERRISKELISLKRATAGGNKEVSLEKVKETVDSLRYLIEETT